MKINIGSKNKVKVEALCEILKEYPDFEVAEVVSCEVESKVSDQPKSLDETVKGAINRAEDAFFNCGLSFGLESGLMKVPKTKTGYMDITVCSIYDGEFYHLGMSSAFEYPAKVLDHVFKEKVDLSVAYRELGFTTKEKIGEEGGIIGDLTKGRLQRKELTKQAIRTALIHLENKELY